MPDPVEPARTGVELPRESAAFLIRATGLYVEFPPVRALDNVAFELASGEIHALMGENGAGKSTLLKVLSGMLVPRSGVVEVQGRAAVFRSLRDANAAGVSTVFQEIDLIPTMSVAENVCLGREPGSRVPWLVSTRRSRERAEAALARVGLVIDTSRALGEYPIAAQQLIAIARALDVRAHTLILDEPTSSLDRGEVARLFGILKHLRSTGVSVVFVTHFLDQVYELADRITVLRNGRLVGTWATNACPKDQLVSAMTGRHIGFGSVQERPASAGDQQGSTLCVDGIARSRVLRPVSFAVRSGEAFGLAGLLGSGRSELLHLLFGSDLGDAGSVSLNGKRIPRGSIRESIRAGMALVPEDRKHQGLVLELSARENIILALQAARGPLRPIARREQCRIADHYIRTLGIKVPDRETPVAELSGGNQQKVLLARWLCLCPKVLLLDEPTRGVDVGARAQIEALIASLCAQGTAIVLVSSELDEIVRACSSALVMRDRAAVGMLTGENLQESSILQTIASAGGEAQ